MLNINKDKFYSQVNGLNINSLNLSMDDFNILYKAAVNELDSDIDFKYIRDTIDKILNGMFSINNSLNEKVVPLNFLSTEIGKAILKVRFGLSTGIYIASDIAKLIGCSRQYIVAEAKRGNIKGEQHGVTWLFTADEVEDYMTKKGLTKEKLYYPEQPENIISGGYERDAEYNIKNNKAEGGNN